MDAKTEPTELLAGIPLEDFETATQVLVKLKDEGRYQVFLVRAYTVRFEGEIDEFLVAFAKKLAAESVDRERGEKALDEIAMVLRAALWTSDQTRAAQMLEQTVFDGIKKVEGKLKAKLQEVVNKKVSLAMDLLNTSLTERSKRLLKESGPVLEDVEIDLVSERDFGGRIDAIKIPFVRLAIRYSEGGGGALQGRFGLWFPEILQFGAKCFTMSADESDIDFLIRRLLAAKRLLERGITAKVEERSTSSKK